MNTNTPNTPDSPEPQNETVDLPTIRGFWDGLSKAEKSTFKKIGVAGASALAIMVAGGVGSALDSSKKSPAPQTEVGHVSADVKSGVKAALDSGLGAGEIFKDGGDDMSIPPENTSPKGTSLDK